MTSILASVLKYAIFTVIVLLASQITVGKKRICDHVGEMTRTMGVQQYVRAVSDKFDFVEGTGSGRAHSRNGRGTAKPEFTDSERAKLSGLLKRSE